MKKSRPKLVFDDSPPTDAMKKIESQILERRKQLKKERTGQSAAKSTSAEESTGTTSTLRPAKQTKEAN